VPPPKTISGIIMTSLRHRLGHHVACLSNFRLVLSTLFDPGSALGTTCLLVEFSPGVVLPVPVGLVSTNQMTCPRACGFFSPFPRDHIHVFVATSTASVVVDLMCARISEPADLPTAGSFTMPQGRHLCAYSQVVCTAGPDEVTKRPHHPPSSRL